jgi:mannose-6-phosphate isomerase-like protein (cupin superfamily)
MMAQRRRRNSHSTKVKCGQYSSFVWKGTALKKVELKDVKPYQAAGHFNMVALKIQGKEETGAQDMWVGLSHFLPGGGATMSANNFEKIYFVLSGMITVITKGAEKIVLKPHDSLYIPPGEGREIINSENVPASMLVIASTHTR